MMKNRKAISPVIATVILVAVAITIAVAVSYWMSGIAGQYTKFEKVEIQSGYAELKPAPGGWVVTLELKNSGSASANLIKVFVNDRPVDLYGTNFAVTQAVLTQVTDEAVGTGDGTKTTFSLDHKSVASVSVKVGGATVTVTPDLIAGTITFATAPTSGAITASYTYVGAKTGTNIPDTGVAIDSGKTANVGGTTPPTSVQVFIGSDLFSSGTTVDIKVHSAGGMDYIKLIGLV